MEALVDLVRAHRRAALAAVAILIAFAALSIARCNSVASERAQEAAGRTGQAQEQAPSDGFEEPGPPQMTGEQQRLVAGYSAPMKELVSALDAYVWESADKNSSLIFDNGSVSCVRGGKASEAVGFAVSAMSGAAVTSDKSAASDDAAPTLVSVLLPDGKTELISIERTAQKDGITLTMTTSLVSGSKMLYTARRRVEEIEMKGLNTKVSDTLGVELEPLAKAVKGKVKEAYPTATEAAFEGDLLIDLKHHTAQMSFALDDARSSKLLVTWDTEKNTFDFGGVK